MGEVEFSNQRGTGCVVAFCAFIARTELLFFVGTTPDGAVAVAFTGTSTSDTFIGRPINARRQGSLPERKEVHGI